MQCDICFRTGGKEYLCPTDARNLLYEPRIQNAQMLLEKDALEQQINTLLANSQSADQGTGSSEISDIRAETEQTVDRTQEIIAHAEELRVKVEKAREEIAKRKAGLARRRADLASAGSSTDARRGRQLEETEKSIRMTNYKWNQGHNTLAASRTFLCGEAAKLYGLRRVRRTGGVEEYKIGGMTIMDLRTLNSASPAHISTALSHIVHLLMLSTHYLAIRLPAEVTLPHRDYPLPTIFQLSASYKHTNVPFPGTTPVPSSNNSPTASRHPEQAAQPRPRPLFVKKPLPILATEDPASYSLFMEAVTLLAYDVAWVCKSQGIAVGEDSSFEDICNMGKNLYNLLIGPRPRPPPSSRNSSTQSTPTKGGAREPESEADEKRIITPNIMGRYSHGSAHSFLGSAEGTEFVRSWKLPSPVKLADKLKSKLMSEVANAEWEILDEAAWAVENDELAADGVVIGTAREIERALTGGQLMHSIMSIRTVADSVEVVGDGNGHGNGDRKPGSSGWTKLKPR